MLKLETIVASVMISLGNCRPTRSHKTQSGDAQAPYHRMLANGRAGKSLWDYTEPAQVISIARWCEIWGTDLATILDSDPKAKRVFLSGNCRFLTRQDAIETLAKEGIVLTDDQLKIPVFDLTDTVKSKLDCIAIQVGDNEKDTGRIKIAQHEKLAIVIEAKANGCDVEEATLKNRLKFARGDQQIFHAVVKAWRHVKGLRKRMLSAPTDPKAIAELDYSVTGPFPVKKWPRAKMVTLFKELEKARKESAVKFASKTKTIASDIEALLCEALTSGGSADKRLGIGNWTSAAEETGAREDCKNGYWLIVDCVEKADLADFNMQIGEIMRADTSDSLRWFRMGREIDLARQASKAQKGGKRKTVKA